MKCPICDGVRMREVDKNGVHIDVCPECKGVWLDRGELDKLMSGIQEVRQEYNEWHNDGSKRRDDRYEDDNRRNHDRDSSEYNKNKHKKKNPVLDMLSDLF
ncbi:cytoplasmic protein [Paenibacillus macquariensis subsp. defensor]|nr:cytoplasmic protein [Paenibacillus macquariensis subsp. defensor]